MPTKRQPHKGSLQYHPRKRALRLYPRVKPPAKTLLKSDKVSIAGFAGYKVGMTHAIVKDSRKKSMHKQPIAMSATVLECPPLKVIGVRAYAQTPEGLQPVAEVVTKGSKELSRKINPIKKKVSLDVFDSKENITDIRLQVQTQPALAGFGRKRLKFLKSLLAGRWLQINLVMLKRCSVKISMCRMFSLQVNGWMCMQ